VDLRGLEVRIDRGLYGDEVAITFEAREKGPEVWKRHVGRRS
jgi:hypothetical protein